ncbi:MAG: hypothetical protein KBT53_02005 [Porticoccus sp.]|nr:hypothetical protein [Porticoccus sp.]MBQ0806730.1 hypothetical protein [Porticoccus sp.]
MKQACLTALVFITIFFFGANLVQASSPVDNRKGSDPWQFQVNLYGWLPDAPATVNVNGQEVVDVPEDLDTILDSLDRTAMFELQARKGKITLFANTVHYEGSYGENFTGPISSVARNMSLEEEVFTIPVLPGGRLEEPSQGMLDNRLKRWEK